jgi:hypothetical protein
MWTQLLWTNAGRHSVRTICEEAEKRNSRIKVVALTPNKARFDCDGVELIDSHDPAELLKLLESLGGRTDI